MSVAFTLADRGGSGCNVEYHLVSQKSCHASNKESWAERDSTLNFQGKGHFPSFCLSDQLWEGCVVRSFQCDHGRCRESTSIFST